MVYEHYDEHIKNLNRRIDELQEEIRILRSEIFHKRREKNLYNTSSTADENTQYHEWDLDYGQQGIT